MSRQDASREGHLIAMKRRWVGIPETKTVIAAF